MSSKLYNEDSIQSLDPLSFTRLRPQVYAGDCTYSTQTLVEIFSNCLDEVRLGHGNLIEVSINGDEITVRDEGQGFLPNSVRKEDGKTILEAAFSVLNTSAKFSEDGTYQGSSLGSFGIGSKITTFLSHYLEVKTWRDGQFEKVYFTEGKFTKRESGTEQTSSSGTIVKWQPSEEFFTNTQPDEKVIKDLFQTTACLCPGLTILLNWNGKEIKYYSANGLKDFADKKVKGKEIIKNRLYVQNEQEKNKIDLVMTYSDNYSSTIIPYVNAGLTESGPHITQIKAAITRVFNKFLRDKKILKDKDENLSGDNITEGMFLFFNFTSAGVGYNAQVKSVITKFNDIKWFLNIFTSAYEDWLSKNEKEIKVIAEKAITSRRAEMAAKRAKEAVRNKVEKKKQFLNLPSKLVDCWGKDRSKCELLIVEGDSAAGGLVEARSAEVSAIFPIRGKIIAAYKNTPEKVFANQEVQGIIKALGLDLDPKTQKLIYNPKKLRYGKVLLAEDADFDGASIRNLLIELFWWLCPELVENGHIYTTMPPLFRVTTKKNEYIFLKDENALEEYKAQHRGEKFQINRNKGLGEQDSAELAEALLNPETRNIKQLVVKDRQKTEELLEILLGKNVPPRREYLLKHSEEANEVD